MNISTHLIIPKRVYQSTIDVIRLYTMWDFTRHPIGGRALDLASCAATAVPITKIVNLAHSEGLALYRNWHNGQGDDFDLFP